MTESYASLDFICGDKCIISYSKCECGDTIFDYKDYLYCCIPKNETCKIHSMYVQLYSEVITQGLIHLLIKL